MNGNPALQRESERVAHDAQVREWLGAAKTINVLQDTDAYELWVEDTGRDPNEDWTEVWFAHADDFKDIYWYPTNELLAAHPILALNVARVASKGDRPEWA